MPILEVGDFEAEIPEGLSDEQISNVARAVSASVSKLHGSYKPPLGASILSAVGKTAGDIADIGSAARSAISSLPLTPFTLAVKAAAPLVIPKSKEEVYGQAIGLAASPLAEAIAGKIAGALIGDLAAPAAAPATEALTAAQKVAQAIRGSARITRSEQEALYSAERSKRFAAAQNAALEKSGEDAYKSVLANLKGELPKVEFKGIRDQIPLSDINSLYDLVRVSPNLDITQKTTAWNGLSKLLARTGGVVPNNSELDVLGKVFPGEFIDTVLEKRPILQKAWQTAGDALNIPRAAMATADLSAPLRQGIFLASKPKQFLPALAGMFRYFTSEKAYEGLAQEIASRPSYPLMQEARLALTDVGRSLNHREEAFKSNLIETVPVFGALARASNRAYSGFLNKLRADAFDSILNLASQTGAKQTPRLIEDAASFVNSATGRGNISIFKGSQGLLGTAFFSPRLIQSRINLLNPMFYINLHPIVRREAVKSLLSFGALGASVLSLAKLNGADVGMDPRSADFAKIRIGNTRYDPWGGFQQYMVLATRLATGQMIDSTTGKEFDIADGFASQGRLGALARFFEFKTSPVASFSIAALRGKNSLGEEFRPGPETLGRFIPMLAQDIYDIYRENGAPGLYRAIPSVFGAGTQTYGPRIPLIERGKFGSPSVKFRQAPGLAEAIINGLTGAEISNVPAERIASLQKERLSEIQNSIEAQKAKSRVLATGKPEISGNKLFYLNRGVVESRAFGGNIPSGLQRKAAIEEFLNAPR